MPLLLRGRIVTWCSVLLLCPFAGVATFFFAWNLSRRWPNPDLVSKIFKIAAMILNALFAVKCLFMVHSLRLKSKALSFALFCTLGVAATISNCCWFAFMLSRRGFDSLCENDAKACQRKVLTITFSAFIIIYAILTVIVMLCVFYFDAHWNYGPPNPSPATPPQPYTQVPTTAHSLRKYLPSSSRFTSWSPITFGRGGGSSEKGHHVPLINITHDYGDDDVETTRSAAGRKGENVVLFDSAGPGIDGRGESDAKGARTAQEQNAPVKDDDFAASSSESDESDEEAQLEYERRRRERKGKARAGAEV
ncbi:hypothetical protein JCM11491_000225 [Sporobolomyces phaffii]